MALLSIRGVGLSFGGPKLLDGVDLTIEAGERICLLGRNGEGKSTLLRLISGEIGPDEGSIIRQQGLRVARLLQDVPAGHGGTVADEVAEGLAHDDHGFGGEDHRVQSVVSRVGLDPDAKFSELSSGMKRRVLLAQAIVAEPDVLLLDEPTNHLDIESIGWLEGFLLRYPGTIVFVTHDRVFLQKLATRIVELDRGRLMDWACDYPTFLVRRDQLLAAENRERDLFDKKLAEEEKWIRKGIEARRTRNEGRVRALEAMRRAHQRRRDRQGTARIQAQEAERSGMLVIEAEDVEFGYGERSIVRDLSATIVRGDKVGVIGPNGAGKTTLLRLLLGQLAPRSGTIRQGTNLEVSYFEQLKSSLDDEKTVQKNISDYDMITIDGREKHILGYLQDFLFTPDRARTLVKYLSGGERSRLLLAKLFTKPSNVLVLDEPTNDLDLETLELLESLLVEYQGTVLIVSHDRAFLNDVSTSVLAVEADGRVKEYEGGYDDYLRQLSAERPAEASPPPSSSPAAPKAAAKSAAPKVQKLTNLERKELQTLPGKIEKLETELAALHETMADPAFYKQDRDAIAQTNAKLQALEADLASAYERWEALDAIGG
ncbi:ATP-binding cassette domain-containing protein [Planctomyces sp. SH-PL62]|uniref:ATP-binding cassette domain-containing protein n=1 Tax=Planctomyces sp. SH-PL62 TaxID=1636152 RepID=UPI00078BF73A|nr:ATP-binding cassette domain-containing protein [Planctomyces sp. SH-PL62]AMV40520.1 ABC transporter ATP-binding protein uup [Planctomyces sp. SH-PL62]